MRTLEQQKSDAFRDANFGGRKISAEHDSVEAAERAGWTFCNLIEAWIPPNAPNPLRFGAGIREVYDD